MQTYNNLFENVLGKLVDQKIAQLIEALTTGAHDFATMQLMVGQIKGLRFVKDELFPEANDICMKN
jgi:hypothetical protein